MPPVCLSFALYTTPYVPSPRFPPPFFSIFWYLRRQQGHSRPQRIIRWHADACVGVFQHAAHLSISRRRGSAAPVLVSQGKAARAIHGKQRGSDCDAAVRPTILFTLALARPPTSTPRARFRHSRERSSRAPRVLLDRDDDSTTAFSAVQPTQAIKSLGFRPRSAEPSLQHFDTKQPFYEAHKQEMIHKEGHGALTQQF